MINYNKFRALRLSQFVEASCISKLEKWAFIDRVWVGEAVGFTEWLRPSERPEYLESISMDLTELEHGVAEEMFETLRLPLGSGMTRP